MKISRIFRPITLVTALAGSALYGCGTEDKSGNGMPSVATYDVDAARKRQEELFTTKPTTPSTQSTVQLPSTSATTIPTIPGTTTVPNVPTGPKPVLPGPVTPGQPNVPNVTEESERKPRNKPSRKSFMNNVSKNSEKTGFSYFSVTEPQNFVGAIGYGRLQNPKSGDLSLDGYGAAGIANLDVRLFNWLRIEVSGSYAEDVARREGKNSITNIGLARLGSELVLVDNKNAYLSLGPIFGINSVRNEDAIGFEPSDLDALSIGGKARVSLKNLGLEAYISALQSVEGKHKTTEGLEFNYNVRELRAGLKQHLGKGVSVGVEGSDVFQETKDVTKFWIRNGSGYVELKDFVKGLSAWGIVSGRDIDAPGKQRANELELRLRLLADVGYGVHFGIGGAYSFSKVQGTKGSNNSSLDALFALGF